ncbi:hypothetical protein [Sporosarcina sp. FSL K6-3457]|uniref:hypothetical protein n=1 Tax=Sporosarcina sp. FSL K6-3457 TaxID=2978204 RepID=UPI0030FB6086
MKKWLVVFIALLSVFFVSACSSESDKLAGKTLNVAYTPVLQEDVDNPNKYDSIKTLKFSDDNVVSIGMEDTKGTYELNGDILVVNIENENEKLKVKYIDFKESEKDFSAYSALIDDIEFHSEDSNKVMHLKGIANKHSKNMPVEFIGK